MKLKTWLIVGILSELILLVYCYISLDDIGEVFRHAARYSGRLSFILYILCLYLFAKEYKKPNSEGLTQVKKAVTVFCILHLIHLGFLATNIYLNDIALVPVKLAGGFLAYALIVVYPFVINRVKTKSALHFIYFYYVGFVMAVTYMARINGQFEGASPEVFHYFGFTTVILALLGFTLILVSKKKTF